MTTTDTPRTDACPHCMAKPMRAYLIAGKEVTQHICGSWSDSTREELTDLCLIRERAEKAKAEVERLRDELAKGEKVLSTIVSALEDAVPWIRETLNRD